MDKPMFTRAVLWPCVALTVGALAYTPQEPEATPPAETAAAAAPSVRPDAPANIGEPGRGGSGANPLKNAYFGEQHLHTQDSPDAFAMGTRNSRDDAYNFCKGVAIKKSTTGEMVQKKTPYDWCATTDHAFMLGLLPQTLDSSNPLSKTEFAKLVQERELHEHHRRQPGERCVDGLRSGTARRLLRTGTRDPGAALVHL